MVGGYTSPNTEYRLTLNGTATVLGNSMGGSMSGTGIISFIVPDTNTYSVSNNGSGAVVGTATYGWWELR
jgi:hypothetical protein